MVMLLIVLASIVYSAESIKVENIVKSVCNRAKAITASILVSTVMIDSMSEHIAVAVESKPLPVYYGLKKGRLLVCKPLSNCLSTSSITSIDKYSAPWTFSGDAREEFNKLLDVISSDKYLTVAEADIDKLYIHAEAKSAVPPTGVDDLEFLINSVDSIITYRSNSRDLVMTGTQALSDGGSNKNRMESIRRKLGVSEMRLMSTEAEDYIRSEERRGLLGQMQQASMPSEVNFLDNSTPQPVVE